MSMFDLQAAVEYGAVDPRSLPVLYKDSLSLVKRLQLSSRLKFHRGCVNSVAWSSDGRELLSGSDDCNLVISNPFAKKINFTVKTQHQSNIFSAKFLPMRGEYRLVSCAGNGSVQYTELAPTGDYTGHTYNCHTTTVYQVQVNPGDHNEFITCEERGMVRVFDLRTKTSCNCAGCDQDVMYKYSVGVTAMCVHPLRPYYLALGLSDGRVDIVDRRMTSSECVAQFKPSAIGERCRITSVQFDPTGSEILTSYSENNIYLFNFLNPNASPLDNAHQRHHYMCGTFGRRIFKNRERVGFSQKAHPQDPLPHSGSGGRMESGGDSHPMARIRLRGDWSDTGPDACPEAEEGEEEGRPVGVMDRLSSLLTHWVEDSLLQPSQTEDEQKTDTPSSAPSTDPVPPFSSTPPTAEQTLDCPSATPTADQRSNYPSAPPTVGQRSDHPLATPTTEQRSDPLAPPTTDQLYHPSAPPTADQRSYHPSATPILTVSDVDDTPPPQLQPNTGSSSSDSQSTPSSIHLSTQTSQHSLQTDSESNASCTGSKSMSNVKTQSSHSHFHSKPNSHNRSGKEENCDKNSSCLRSEDGSNDQSTASTGGNSPYCHYLSYKGHRNSRTIIKQCNFWGANFVMSGSDCGRVFVWDKWTGEIVNAFVADHRVVNCIQPHPQATYLATSGIDYDIKLWEPIASQPCNLEDIPEVVARNERMLKETRGTITIPSSSMLRFLAILVRRGMLQERGQNNVDSD